MDNDESPVDRRATERALIFGSLIRSRRKALKMRQDQLALATGVGRRFLIDLEAGKPSCQLGRSLLVAQALGLEGLGSLGEREGLGPAAGPPLGGSTPSVAPTAPELPDLAEEEEQPDGRSAGLL
jgi:transcriptional regulator with XRE-family HTH domain